MQPKTKFQKEVFMLSKKLRVLTRQQKSWIVKTIPDFTAAILKNTIYCLECGHKWKSENITHDRILVITCPVCKKPLTISEGYSRNESIYYYFVQLTVVNDFQVIRYFLVEKFLKKFFKASILTNEVMQHWIRKDGKITSLSVTVNSFSHWIESSWRTHTPLEIRHSKFLEAPRATVMPSYVFPNQKVLPELKRNGFRTGFHNVSPPTFFKELLTNPKAETLLKAKQYRLLVKACYYPEKIVEAWPSIRIAIRNNYMVKDATNWLDYLSILNRLNMDVRNPTIICPKNLNKAHDKYLDKLQVIRDRKSLAEKLEKIEREEFYYAKSKRKFFNLNFKAGNITVLPIKKVKEVYEIATSHRHCAYSLGYHKKNGFLLLKAIVNKEAMEMIELDLENMKIVQSRGKMNKPTPYNKKIISLVKQNLPEIQKLVSKTK